MHTHLIACGHARLHSGTQPGERTVDTQHGNGLYVGPDEPVDRGRLPTVVAPLGPPHRSVRTRPDVQTLDSRPDVVGFEIDRDNKRNRVPAHVSDPTGRGKP